MCDEPTIQLNMKRYANGQFGIRLNGKTVYLGSDEGIATARGLVYSGVGFAVPEHSLKDFCLQYCVKVGCESWDQEYIAIQTAKELPEHLKVEDAKVWFDLRADFAIQDDPNRVYVIADIDGDVKIGHARNVQNRFYNLQTAHKTELTLLASLPGGKRHEESLHREFKDYRIRGEWFSHTGKVGRFLNLLNKISERE